jgi:hypothetical protein
MEKLILFFLLFVFRTGYSQTFEMNELVKISMYSDEYLEYVVAEKGYKFFETKNEQDYIVKVYVNNSKVGKSYFITKLKYKNNKEVLVSYRTTIDGEYLKWKNNMIESLFEGIKKRPSDKIIFHYTNDDIEISYLDPSYDITKLSIYLKSNKIDYEIDVSTTKK